MWIVRLALRRPYTFVVMSVLIVILGLASIVRTPKDIFPDIDIPVISVIWTYNGLSAQDFEQRITIYSEFALSSNVNDIERIESQTIDGVGIIRLHFHPGVKISDSLAQATAVSQAILRRMPTGVQPPIILRYTAASVPIVQMSLASDKMSESRSLRLRHLPHPHADRGGQWHHAADALRRHGAHGHGRSRSRRRCRRKGSAPAT